MLSYRTRIHGKQGLPDVYHAVLTTSDCKAWPPLNARPDHPWLQRHNQLWLSRPDRKPIQNNNSKLSLSKDELILMSHASHDRRMGSLAQWSISESVPTSQKSQTTMKQILISILPSAFLELTCKWFCEEGNIVRKPTTQLLWDLYVSPRSCPLSWYSALPLSKR